MFPPQRCEVTERCRHRAYVRLWTPLVDQSEYPAVCSCRVHVSMLIASRVDVTDDIRIQGV